MIESIMFFVAGMLVGLVIGAATVKNAWMKESWERYDMHMKEIEDQKPK